MDAFYEEDDRILGHAADPYHRIDIRHTSRRLVVRAGERVVADTTQPRRALRVRLRATLVRAARRRRRRRAVAERRCRRSARTKGIASYYDIDGARNAAWSYRAPLDEMAAIGDLVSFEPDRVEVTLDGRRLELEPGQNVVSHGIDRNLDIGEAGALTAVPAGAS